MCIGFIFLQARLRMETLKCRAYARKNLRDRNVTVDDLEAKLREKRARLSTVLWHNEKIRKVRNQCSFSPACISILIGLWRVGGRVQ